MFWGDPGIFSNFFRWFFSLLDGIGYFFLGGIFNVFFTIANAQFFQGGVINTFYTRIQMILGIFMIFRISITLLQIIVNPDVFKDKQKGAGSIVMRIAVMLVLLTLIVPIEGISESDPNPLNQQIRTNGILFGFLNQVQNTVVQDNVLGKLILGYNVDEDGSNLQLNGLDSVGDVLTAEIAHAFITPTLKDGYTEANDDPNSDNYYENSTVCPTDIAPSLNPAVTSGALLEHINDTCMGDDGETYAFEYIGFGGLVCSIVMTIIVIGFTLDIAVRAIKLALLRLIAPIPIISYISPGQEKDGAFGNWVKTLTSTYLSLFIRLIIIYFGIYLIILLRNGELVTWIDSSVLANIFVIIGILVFMKQAPKFFQDMLGLKGDGKLFSGIGTMLGAAALTGGLVGSMATNARASWEEDTDFRKGGGKGRAALSALKAVGSAGIGGIGGAFVGAKTLASTDKKVPSSVFSAMQRRNAARASGVTTIGKAQAGISALVTGRAMGAKEDKALELLQAHVDAQKGLKDMVDEQSLKSTTETGTLALPTGERLELNYSNFDNMRKNAIARGERYMDVTDVRGRTARVDLDTLDPNVMKDFEESQASNLLMHQRRLTPDDDGYDIKIHGKIQEAEYAATNVQEEIDLYDYSSVKGKGIGGGLNAIRDIKTSRKKDRYRANSKAINANEK